MQIQLKLYATLADLLPTTAVNNTVTLDVEPSITPHQLIDQFNVPRPKAHLVLINGVYIEPEERDSAILKPGDTFVVFPPVAGG
ncbi:MAG: MoaD/ThiS family protein [Gammaproteobacteria bacterium]